MIWPKAMVGRLGGAVLASMLCWGYWAAAPQGARAQEAQGPSPRIEFEPAELDLGGTYAGQAARGSFKIWNRGDAPLVISRIRKTCGCMVVALREEQKTIMPGTYTTVEVGLKPGGSKHNSVFKKSVYVLSNDPENPRAGYSIFTTLLLPVVVQPANIAFEDVEPGETVRQRITLRSTTDKEFAISALELPDGPISAKFEKGFRAKFHEVELVVGPVGHRAINGVCAILTTHPRMQTVKVPLRVSLLRPVTVEPRTLMLGRVMPGTLVRKKIRLTPAPGYVIERAELEVERYPSVEVAATKDPGGDNLWNVVFRIPVELAGRTMATRVKLTEH